MYARAHPPHECPTICHHPQFRSNSLINGMCHDMHTQMYPHHECPARCHHQEFRSKSHARTYWSQSWTCYQFSQIKSCEVKYPTNRNIARTRTHWSQSWMPHRTLLTTNNVVVHCHCLNESYDSLCIRWLSWKSYEFEQVKTFAVDLIKLVKTHKRCFDLFPSTLAVICVLYLLD